jgi:hypothetical protein
MDGPIIEFVSSGDPAKDREDAKRFVLHEQRINRGECPNGDGLLVDDSKYPGTFECPQCGFAYSGPARWRE